MLALYVLCIRLLMHIIHKNKLPCMNHHNEFIGLNLFSQFALRIFTVYCIISCVLLWLLLWALGKIQKQWINIGIFCTVKYSHWFVFNIVLPIWPYCAWYKHSIILLCKPHQIVTLASIFPSLSALLISKKVCLCVLCLFLSNSWCNNWGTQWH